MVLGRKKKCRLRGLQGLIGTHKAINYFITTSVFYSLVYKSFSLVHITAARLSRDNLESLYRNLTELQNFWLELFMVICFPKDHKLVWAQTLGFICMADCVEVNAQGPLEPRRQQTEPAPAWQEQPECKSSQRNCPWCWGSGAGAVRGAVTPLVLVMGLSFSPRCCPWYQLSTVLSTRSVTGAVHGAEATSLSVLWASFLLWAQRGSSWSFGGWSVQIIYWRMIGSARI